MKRKLKRIIKKLKEWLLGCPASKDAGLLFCLLKVP